MQDSQNSIRSKHEQVKVKVQEKIVVGGQQGQTIANNNSAPS